MRTERFNVKGLILVIAVYIFSLANTQCSESAGMDEDLATGDLKSEASDLSQALSDELTEKGSNSRKDALKVGAFIEEVDIIDLRNELGGSAKNEEVIRVYSKLCAASENHLRAFVRVLALYEVDYVPVLLDKEEFDRILEN